MEKTKKTKMALADLPEFDSTRGVLLANLLHGSEEYKKALEEGFPGLSQSEIINIIKKYNDAEGVTMLQIISEFKKKGQIIKTSMIQRYAREKKIPGGKRVHTKNGAITKYDASIFLYLNFIRFAISIGKDEYELIYNEITSMFQLSEKELLNHYSEENEGEVDLLYNEGGFFDLFWQGIVRIEDALDYLNYSVDLAFKNDRGKYKEYKDKACEAKKLVLQLKVIIGQIEKLADRKSGILWRELDNM